MKSLELSYVPAVSHQSDIFQSISSMAGLYPSLKQSLFLCRQCVLSALFLYIRYEDLCLAQRTAVDEMGQENVASSCSISGIYDAFTSMSFMA
jgi:hypothetical protein